MRVRKKYFRKGCEQSSASSPTDYDSSLWEHIRPRREWILGIMVVSFSQSVRKFCPLTFLSVLPCRWATRWFLQHVSLRQITLYRTWGHQGLPIFSSSSTRCGVLEIQHKFQVIFPNSSLDIVHVNGEKVGLFAMHSKSISIQANTSPLPFSNRKILTQLRSNSNPVSGCPYSSLSNGTTGSLMLSHDFGHRDWRRRMITVGHSDSWYCVAYSFCASWWSGNNVQNVGGCHVRRGRSMFGNTACELATSSTTSSRDTTRPFYFWNIFF